jgi:hypothetical protein
VQVRCQNFDGRAHRIHYRRAAGRPVMEFLKRLAGEATV